jgi:D-3-phosphoglycerate dehydrogenase
VARNISQSHDGEFNRENNITFLTLDKVLSDSDIVSIHVNLNDHTKNMINKSRLELMKSNAILINTSRGEIIDEQALFTTLQSKKIGGAGLDVFDQEPYSGHLKNWIILLLRHILERVLKK